MTTPLPNREQPRKTIDAALTEIKYSLQYGKTESGNEVVRAVKRSGVSEAKAQIYADIMAMLPKKSYKHLRWCQLRYEEACSCGLSRRNETITQLTKAITAYFGEQPERGDRL
jgi:hypothetical protein